MRPISSFGEVVPILLAAFVAAAGISLVLTPLVRRLSLRMGNVDQPNHRRVNETRSRGAAVAVAAAFIAVAVASS